ncbi:sulfotransferase [uncultured Thiohalocapsa sp.]|uniref:sulfotransferase family protein n=1 Tax=uncultured Thiohalocapsa sp. TaxID=768990 RepID=UPI0025F07E37|nr:sulfotransferase [uncultured Thiohalocapsa sp.]
MSRKPDFFIVGGPKCGTTALARYLSEHWDIRFSSDKEPNYFCKDIAPVRSSRIDSDQAYLNRFFPGIEDAREKAIGEASVWNLYSTHAAKRILRFNPDARFIVMIRNPADMAFSLYSMLSFQGQEDQPTFRNAWELQDIRRRSGINPPGNWSDISVLLYKDVCSLGSQLERLYDTVPPDRVLVLSQDDMRENTKRVYQRALGFLGVSDDLRATFPRTNEGRKLKNSFIVKIARTRTAIAAAKSLKQTLGIKTLSFGRPDLVMSSETRAFLSREFAHEISKLENLLGWNLSAWKPTAPS